MKTCATCKHIRSNDCGIISDVHFIYMCPLCYCSIKAREGYVGDDAFGHYEYACNKYEPAPKPEKLKQSLERLSDSINKLAEEVNNHGSQQRYRISLTKNGR